jgi:hypothetical protein
MNILQPLSIEDIQVLTLDCEKVNRTLPDDILRSIYDNYLSPQLVYDKLQNILKSKESQSLNYYPLGEYLENVVFKEPLVIEKLKKEDSLFLFIYRTEIGQNIRTFVKFTNKYQSFSLTWLMNLYH